MTPTNPDDARYTLTELADLAGVTPRTVRYYLAQGLLPGVGVAGPGAKYDDTHLARLRLIRRLQAEHQPLAEIRHRLESVDDATVLALGEPPDAGPTDSALEYLRRVTGSPPATAIARRRPPSRRHRTSRQCQASRLERSSDGSSASRCRRFTTLRSRRRSRPGIRPACLPATCPPRWHRGPGGRNGNTSCSAPMSSSTYVDRSRARPPNGWIASSRSPTTCSRRNRHDPPDRPRRPALHPSPRPQPAVRPRRGHRAARQRAARPRAGQPGLRPRSFGLDVGREARPRQARGRGGAGAPRRARSVQRHRLRRRGRDRRREHAGVGRGPPAAPPAGSRPSTRAAAPNLAGGWFRGCEQVAPAPVGATASTACCCSRTASRTSG